MQVTASKKEIWTMGSYSLLTLSIMVGFMYLNTFATEVLKIPATTLANALLVAKTIDFIVSMFAGVIIEKVKLGNKGKNQEWLLVGRWILAVCIAAEVFPTGDMPLAIRVCVLTVSYAVLNSLMNLIQTAYYGVLGVVAGANHANRNAMTINMTRQSTVITLVTSFIPTLVSKLNFGQWNYFVVAVAFMIPMPWALGRIAKAGDGKDAPVGTGAAGNRISIKDMIDSLAKNPQLLALFAMNTILSIGTYIASAQATYYWIYVAGDFSKMTVSSLCTAVVGFCAAMFMPKIGMKLGKKNANVIGILWLGLCTLCNYFFARKGYYYLIAATCIGALGTYMRTPFAMTMYMDAGEYYLWKTGKDTRAISMGLASPPMKIGMALGGTIGLYLLNASGYEAGFTPDAEWVNRFSLGCYLVPACIYIAAGLVLLFCYKITDADAMKYSKENAERMAAGKQ